MIDLVGLVNSAKKWGLPVVVGAFVFYHFDQKLAVIEEAQPDKRLAVLEAEMKYANKRADAVDVRLDRIEAKIDRLLER